MESDRGKITLGNALFCAGFFLVGFGLGQGIAKSRAYGSRDFTGIVIMVLVGFLAGIVGEYIVNRGAANYPLLKTDRRFLVAKLLNMLGSVFLGIVIGLETEGSWHGGFDGVTLVLCLLGLACLLPGSILFYKSMKENLF